MSTKGVRLKSANHGRSETLPGADFTWRRRNFEKKTATEKPDSRDRYSNFPGLHAAAGTGILKMIKGTDGSIIRCNNLKFIKLGYLKSK